MAGEARKTVTIVFTDVTGSTSLGEQLDPEALRGVMARYFETAQTVLERHGGTVEKFIGDAAMAVFGIPTMHEDDAVRAVRAAAELRDELAARRDRRESLLSTLAFNLGEALYLQGRWEEAEQFTRVSEDLAPPDDIASQVGWRAVRAKILARRAELEQAERLSTEALRLIEQTDALSHHADVLVRRAEVLRLGGRTDDAKGALEEGIRLYETKGILPAVERTRALLSELTG